MRIPTIILGASAALAVACSESVAPTAPVQPRAAGVSLELSAAAVGVGRVSATSGRSYRLVTSGGFKVGVRHFSDRTYTITSVPAALVNAPYIQTANDDRANLAGSSLLSFTVDRRTTVYVAHDDRAARPAWLRDGFVDTGLDLQTSYRHTHSLFKRTYDAGTVTLGANIEAPCAQICSMYAVVLVPADTGSASPPAAQARAGFYVAPNGSAANDGSYARPWDLKTALAQPGRIHPGDTVWMRGGTYAGTYQSQLTGKPGSLVVLRQFPGERAVIDGRLDVHGADAAYWGFELKSSVAAPDDIEGISVHGPRTRFINLVLHDNGGNGIGVWSDAPDAEVYGSVIYNNGRQRTHGGYAHGIYGQNVTGTKRLVDNVLFNQNAYGIHAYTEGSGLTGFYIEGNASFNNGATAESRIRPNIFIGSGSVAASRVTVERNMTYTTPSLVPGGAGKANELGYGAQNVDVVVRDNYMAGGWPPLRMVRWSNATVSGNTFYGAHNGMLEMVGGLSGFRWSNNTWYHDPAAAAWYVEGTGEMNWSTFKSRTGLGATDRIAGAAPTGVTVFVRPNAYEAGRANVVIYNWAHASVVPVDLSKVLAAGDRYVVRSVQNLFGAPVASGTYGGGSISLPMQPVAPPTPVGGFRVTPPTTGPEFDVYIVTKQ